MKPHKNEGSTPAGVPNLQEVGYTITYEDVLVTAEYLKQLRAEIKATFAVRDYIRKLSF